MLSGLRVSDWQKPSSLMCGRTRCVAPSRHASASPAVCDSGDMSGLLSYSYSTEVAVFLPIYFSKKTRRCTVCVYSFRVIKVFNRKPP